MIGMRTMLEAADNSGAKKLQCILPRGGDLGLRAGLGDVVTASVKEAAPESQIKKGKVVRCVIVRMRQGTRRKRTFAAKPTSRIAEKAGERTQRALGVTRRGGKKSERVEHCVDDRACGFVRASHQLDTHVRPEARGRLREHASDRSRVRRGPDRDRFRAAAALMPVETERYRM